MWFIPTKQEMKKELEKVIESFRLRDKDLENHSRDIKDIKETTETNKVKIARLEGMISVLLQGKTRSHSQAVSLTPKPSQNKFETKLINRVRKSKKALVIAEIVKLIDSNTTPEMFDIIVREKGLCSKATFYRYIASLRSQESPLIPQEQDFPETKFK